MKHAVAIILGSTLLIIVIGQAIHPFDMTQYFFFMRPEFLDLSPYGKLAYTSGYILGMLILLLVAVRDESKKEAKNERAN